MGIYDDSSAKLNHRLYLMNMIFEHIDEEGGVQLMVYTVHTFQQWLGSGFCPTK